VQAAPQADALAKLNAWPKFKERFGDVEATELRVLCSQKRSATCTDLLGLATVPYKGFMLEVQLGMTLDEIKELRFPADDAELDMLLASPLFGAMKAAATKDHEA